MALKPVDYNKLNHEYNRFHEQMGNGLDIPVFSGVPYQKGYGIGSMLSGLFKSALPIIKKGAMHLGKTALKTGLNIADDAIKGSNVKQAMSKNLLQAGSELVGTLTTKALGKRKPQRNINNVRYNRKRISNVTFKKRGGKKAKRDIFD